MSKTWKDSFHERWQNGNSFFCSGQQLTSLEGAPSTVVAEFFCDANYLTSLEHAPSFIGGSFNCSYNRLTSLKDIHLQIKHIGGTAYLHSNPIKSHVLGLLLIDGLQAVMLNRLIDPILNYHLPSKGMESVLLAQEELILEGFEEYAQL